MTDNISRETAMYRGKPMAFEPINMTSVEVTLTLYMGEPIVVILEPGDATRYTLLLLPLHRGDSVSPYLQAFGIQECEDEGYLFVSKLSGDECPGTWIPFGSGWTVGVHDVVELSTNEWSREFLAWWFTKLCEVY